MNRTTTFLFFISFALSYQIDITPGPALADYLGATAVKEYNEGMAKNAALARSQGKLLSNKATDAAESQKKMICKKISETVTVQEKLLSSQAASLATAQGDVLAERTKKEAQRVTRRVLETAETAKKNATTAGSNGIFHGAGKVLDDAIESFKVKALAAAPYVAVGGITIGIYLLYRYNSPSPVGLQQQVVIVENGYKNAVTARKTALQTARTSLSQCLRYNARGEINTQGFPTACENPALTYTLLAGPESAQETIETFKGEASRPLNAPLYGMILLGIASS